jgi:hypothetical protein
MEIEKKWVAALSLSGLNYWECHVFSHMGNARVSQQRTKNIGSKHSLLLF